MFPGIPEGAQEFVVCKHPWGYNVPNPTITGAFMLEYDAITIKIDDKRLDHGGKRVIAATTLTCSCLAQKPSPYTDPGTGIAFTTWNIPLEDNGGDLTFGMALPSNALKTDATEFIGYIVSSPPQSSAQTQTNKLRTTPPMANPAKTAGAASPWADQ
ncbi:predicted protein [Aspergillus terreus NIH2624]|uniref:Cellobiose dehydrogenase-like cytochrome domain-containing protein n=1 Tax=Aspergillus terreus (strain NIH 2624 / FGSC A1156) TaxID=341663 RepID=Q0CUG6_ASPTN|nr:uncharacterized protein ATEG_02668 [Aspergillus terreus NIH2624]EAU37630.1 predicted protein [Aspergillus terreus NIH2624]